MELSRKSSHAQLKSYQEARHELLAPLLPADTSCNDLFSEVDSGGSIGDFFDASDDAARVGRELKRLGHQVGAWLIEEKAQQKAKQKRDKKDAERQAALERQKKKPRIFHGEPPKPPTMDFEAAQLVASQAAAKRQEGARTWLL